MVGRRGALALLLLCVFAAVAGETDDHHAVAPSDGGDDHGGAEAHGHDHPKSPAAPMIVLVLAMAFGVLAKTLLAKTKIPYTVLLLLAGMVVGFAVDYRNVDAKRPIHRSVRAWDKMNPHLLLYVFLPILIFESAFSIELHTLERELWQVLTLAVPGVALSCGLTAGVAMVLFGDTFTWPAALMFGAILSATDPVAVVALLKELGVSKRLGVLLEGESLLNDGTAIVIFNVFFAATKAAATDQGGGGLDGGAVVAYFLRLAVGGPLLGLLTGGATAVWLGYIYDDAMSEITLTIVAAIGTFLLAEMVTVDGEALTSGVLAVVALGLVVGSRGLSRVSASVGHDLHAVWECLGFVANTTIFFVAGMIVEMRLAQSNDVLRDLRQLGLLYAALHGVRAVVLAACWPVLRRLGYGVSAANGVALWWGALRGAVGLTLALIVEEDHRVDGGIRHAVAFHVAGITFLSLVVNGTSMESVLKAVGLSEKSAEAEAEFEAVGRELVRRPAPPMGWGARRPRRPRARVF